MTPNPTPIKRSPLVKAMPDGSVFWPLCEADPNDFAAFWGWLRTTYTLPTAWLVRGYVCPGSIHPEPMLWHPARLDG